MNRSFITAGSAIAILSTLAHAQSSTLTAPIGWLTASPGMVKLGSTPALTWEINYPATIRDFITITPPATAEAKQTLKYEIRVLGAGVTSSYADGSNLSFVPTEALFSFNGSGYSRIFYGTNHDVIPGRIVASGTALAGQKLRFGGRYYFNGAWSTLYTSSSGNNNVRTLVNGDYPPTTYSLATAPTLENFIKPYLDGAGRVTIGPMDVIVFMELTHTDAQSNQLGYDCQDMVLLVTFKTL